MIRQKPTKTITESYTTTDADNGYRIICNSSLDFTITLHSPTGRYNFDLEIDNKGTGIVTVSGKQLTQNTHAHIGNDNGSSWVVSLGGEYTLTKEKVESVLTGEITSHSHPFNDNVLTGATAPTSSTIGTIGQFYLNTAIPKLYQCTAINESTYTWTEVGSGTIPQATATELGGIKASPKTSGETQEVKIDTATGKLYSTPPTAAQNGLPAGGTISQILKKNSGTNYDAGWGDENTDAESLLTKPINIADFTGKDGYVLAYDETAGEFYLKADEGGGGGGTSWLSMAKFNGFLDKHVMKFQLSYTLSNVVI